MKRRGRRNRRDIPQGLKLPPSVHFSARLKPPQRLGPVAAVPGKSCPDTDPDTHAGGSAPAQIVQIEKPIYGGAFLAGVEGKAVFVPLTLPGEKAHVRVVEEKRGYATAEVEEIVAAAPERVEPSCRHFGACGGCQYQHAEYAAQLEYKQSILRETLERGGVRAPEEIAVLAAKPWAYRNRIRVAFDAHGNPGYRGRRSHAVIPIVECPIAAPLLVQAALAAGEIARSPGSRIQLSEISLFCNADESALLASMVTASGAKSGFEGFTRALAEKVPELKGAELLIEERGGRPPRRVAEWDASSLLYSTAGFDYRVDHGAFFQVNRWLADDLVERVTRGQTGKLAWDLFAGVGLFARRLAESFGHVVAVESAPTAIRALNHNLNGTSARAMRSSTFEFLRSAREGERPDLIVVDPPRTGLGTETTALLGEIAAPGMTYVSCDPATLARDLRALVGAGYAIESVTLADLFPQTFHLETVVRLRR
jgi:23S rRNA (uracil1939-C5)-methyltransferase